MHTVQAYIDRCITHYVRGDILDAVSELKKALRLRPEDPHLHFMMANALYRSKDMAGAANSYAAALRLRPTHFEARISHGFALFETGEFKDAAAEWLSAIRLNPNEPFARAALAVGLYSIREIEDAKVQYAVAVAMDKRYGNLSALRVDIRWSLKAHGTLNRIDKLLRREGSPEDLGRSIILSTGIGR